MASINLLLTNEIQEMSALKWVSCDLRVLVRKLASPFDHPTQVSTQAQLAATCDYLWVHLSRALGPKLSSWKQVQFLLASAWWDERGPTDEPLALIYLPSQIRFPIGRERATCHGFKSHYLPKERTTWTFDSRMIKPWTLKSREIIVAFDVKQMFSLFFSTVNFPLGFTSGNTGGRGKPKLTVSL